MINTSRERCPFKVGDKVVYKPTDKGWNAEANASVKLIPGAEYLISQIQNDYYIIVEGYVHPGGGIYWTEFKKG